MSYNGDFFLIDHKCEGCGSTEKTVSLRDNTELRLCNACYDVLYEKINNAFNKTVQEFIGSRINKDC
jgi:predicted RNA-binding protein with PUA domain